MEKQEIKEKATQMIKHLEGLNFKTIRQIAFEMIYLAEDACSLPMTNRVVQQVGNFKSDGHESGK